MLNNEIQEAFRDLAEEIKAILEKRIRQYGVNPKIGKNTLQGSELEKSIKVEPTENGIALQIANYWEFISRGWERTHNYEGTMALFIRNVDDWIRRKGIRFGKMNQAQMVFLITRNIMEHGLKERPFMVWDDNGDLSKMIPELNESVDVWMDRLFETIIKELNDYFNN